ncbi:Gfo/Idh/MocA family oxidoreductase [Kitasatospora sp. NPDC093558]|uniref:Gfo/Idh/MocA family protein n=1 Tax=Kitasatospora sp. NPDC093558 TaxID=3155201 RepID=UPI00343C048E
MSDAPNRPRLRVAVLGTAHIHLADHLAVLRADGSLTAVLPDHPPWRADLPGVRWAPTARAALSGADAAVICSTTARHDELLHDTLAAGVPALVEKPLAANSARTARLIEPIGRAPALVTTAMFLRCAPALRRVRTLLADRRIGEPTGADLAFCHPGLLDGIFTGRTAWMTSPAHGGTGAFADLGIHLLDLLRWLRPDAPFAVRGAVLRRRPGLAVDVGGTALLDWGGVPVTVRADWTTRPGGLRLRFDGTAGSVAVEDGTVLLSVDGRTGVEAYRPAAAGDALTAFLAALRGDRSAWSPPTPADLTACAEALDAVAAPVA